MLGNLKNREEKQAFHIKLQNRFELLQQQKKIK